MRIRQQRWSRALCLLAWLALASGTLTSCAAKRATYLDNGVRGYLITCGGFFNKWESCLVKAGQICRGRGYDTIRSVEYDRVMLIACKTPTPQSASR